MVLGFAFAQLDRRDVGVAAARRCEQVATDGRIAVERAVRASARRFRAPTSPSGVRPADGVVLELSGVFGADEAVAGKLAPDLKAAQADSRPPLSVSNSCYPLAWSPRAAGLWEAADD